MIGRADIEGSKSNVAMNAWLPQASYPCDVPPQSNSPPDTVFRANRAPPEGDALKARNVTRSEPEPALAAVFHEKRPTQVQAHARRRMEAGVRPVRYSPAPRFVPQPDRPSP
ncbi:unnamed protein product [Clavelina lepadiformis]|uniref:Uncharacterized protein n=1 Tax=Clavelina lepadiformis TaxID=159417 RepID=A0ABP0GXW6_CLALP